MQFQWLASPVRFAGAGRLEDWLGADAEAILPKARSFSRPKILR